MWKFENKEFRGGSPEKEKRPGRKEILGRDEAGNGQGEFVTRREIAARPRPGGAHCARLE